MILCSKKQLILLCDSAEAVHLGLPLGEIWTHDLNIDRQLPPAPVYSWDPLTVMNKITLQHFSALVDAIKSLANSVLLDTHTLLSRR